MNTEKWFVSMKNVAIYAHLQEQAKSERDNRSISSTAIVKLQSLQ